jgi:predicted RNA-binding Zn-ribbon protein involved in translation (DUF1610 family)
VIPIHHLILVQLFLLRAIRLQGGLIMTVATNPKGKLPPVWFRVGRRRVITDQFKKDRRCACIDQWHFFYSSDLSEQAVAKKLCASCPMLHPCTLWSLYGDCDKDGSFGIVAGMDPDQRDRIRSGREEFWDWPKEFNYAAKAAKAAARKRERLGLRKRDQRHLEIPACPGCGSNQYVVREGRDRITSRQQYQCTTCGPYFLGEEL